MDEGRASIDFVDSVFGGVLEPFAPCLDTTGVATLEYGTLGVN
jgi:hypothetical protein